jgi:Transglycosylase SLT domain
MLTRLSVRFPLTLKVALTAMSAVGVIVCASGFSATSGAALADNLAHNSPALPQRVNTTQRAPADQVFKIEYAQHAAHAAHLAHEQLLAEKAAEAAAQAAWAKHEAALRLAAEKAPKVKAKTYTYSAASPAKTYSPPVASGPLTAAEVGSLWIGAGGPAWAESQAVEIASCESGFNPDAYNPSGATGIWQILGAVVPGNLTNPEVNAENAVAKFKAAGNSFAPWVCQ